MMRAIFLRKALRVKIKDLIEVQLMIVTQFHSFPINQGLWSKGKMFIQTLIMKQFYFLIIN